MASNPFIGLSLAFLQARLTAATAAFDAILLNQSYSLNGRTLTRANLNDVKETIGQLQAAIEFANGSTASSTYVNFTS